MTERSCTPSDQSAFSSLADLAEVLAVAVDAEHVAELARVDQLLQLLHARVVEQEVAGHEHARATRRERDELLHLRGAHRGRLLDERVLARLERALRERVMRRHGCRDDDAVDAIRLRAARRSRSTSSRQGSARRTARAATRRDRRARRARRARRSCARGSGPSSRGRPLRPCSQLPDLAVHLGALRRVAEVDDDVAAPHDLRVVDRRMRGHDHDAVVRLGLERRPTCSPSNCATYGSWYATSAPALPSSCISFSAGDSRTSSMSAL